MKRIALIILSVATIIAGSVSCQKENLQENSASEGSASVGTAKATIGGREVDVNWVQLWENGPKFAVYNVGANRVVDYGGYYSWGSSIDRDPEEAFNFGDNTLTGPDDTATNLWGRNWRMPTQEELQALLVNCNVEWTNVDGMPGRRFTGKGKYASNSIFLPAAGRSTQGKVFYDGDGGFYRSSTAKIRLYTYSLLFDSGRQRVSDHSQRDFGYSVRAVLAE